MSAESEASRIEYDHVDEMTCAQCRSLLDVSQLEPFSEIECPECGNHDRVPARLGQFLLLELIGTGGMGGIYRARDESLGRLVAIKVITKAFGQDPDSLEFLKHEAQSAAKLNHPHVAQIYSFGQVSGQPYIEMELVQGKRLDRFIETAEGGLEPAFVLRIGIEIAEGLRAADDAGLVHGDIKPENILVDDNKHAKLVDFGIASLADQMATEGVWGTPYYIAPEKLRQRKSDARSDIYSLGATLYHALAGIPPFEAETPLDVAKARLTEFPVPLSEVNENVDRRLSDTIARTLEREPARRHPTYASLIGDLKRNLTAIEPQPGRSRAPATGKRVVIKQRRTNVEAGPAEEEEVEQPTRAEALRQASLRQAEAVRAAAESRRRISRIVLLCIPVILVLAGAGIVYYFQFQEQKQRELDEQNKQRKFSEARTHLDELVETAYRSATNILDRARQFEPLEERVRETVNEVLNETLETPAPARNANELEAMIERELAGTNQTVIADDGSVLKKDAIRVLWLGQAATAKAQDATPISRAIGLLHDRIMQQPITDRLKRYSETFAEDLELLTTIEKQLAALLLEAEAATARVVASAEAELIRRANSKREEEQERRNEARRVKILNELDSARLLETQGRKLIQAHAFRKAVSLARDGSDQYETDEGLEALARINDRYERMLELHEFLLKRLNSDTYIGGWHVTRSKRVDVQSADSRGVRVQGRTVLWHRVGTRPYLRFVRHYLEDSTIRLRERGRYFFAAALYCYECDGREYCGQFTKRAIDATPILKEEAERLLPSD